MRTRAGRALRFSPALILASATLGACNLLLGNESGTVAEPAVRDATAPSPSPMPPAPAPGSRLASLVLHDARHNLDLPLTFRSDVASYSVRVPWAPLGMRVSLTASFESEGHRLTLNRLGGATPVQANQKSAAFDVNPAGELWFLEIDGSGAGYTIRIESEPPRVAKLKEPNPQAATLLGHQALTIRADANWIVCGASLAGPSATPAGRYRGKLVAFERRGAEWVHGLLSEGVGDNDQVGNGVAVRGPWVGWSAAGARTVSVAALSNASRGTFTTTLDAGVSSAVAFDHEECLWHGEEAYTEGTACAGCQGAIRRLCRDDAADTWVQASLIVGPVLASTTLFGRRLAIDATEGRTLLVGAPYENNQAGAAYAVDLDAPATLVPLPVPAEVSPLLEAGKVGDLFGFIVAVSARHAVVGNPAAREVAGSAYAYTRGSDGIWSEPAVLTRPGLPPTSGERYGHSVALCGDALFVGAPVTLVEAEPVPVRSGVVYAYEWNETEWVLRGTLVPPEPVASLAFGSTVACAGNTVVVGAQADGEGAALSGALFVFE